MWCFGSLGTALLHLGSGRVCVSRGCCFCRGCLAKRRVLGSAGLGGGVGLEVYSVQWMAVVVKYFLTCYSIRYQINNNLCLSSTYKIIIWVLEYRLPVGLIFVCCYTLLLLYSNAWSSIRTIRTSLNHLWKKINHQNIECNKGVVISMTVTENSRWYGFTKICIWLKTKFL